MSVAGHLPSFRPRQPVRTLPTTNSWTYADLTDSAGGGIRNLGCVLINRSHTGLTADSHQRPAPYLYVTASRLWAECGHAEQHLDHRPTRQNRNVQRQRRLGDCRLGLASLGIGALRGVGCVGLANPLMDLLRAVCVHRRLIFAFAKSLPRAAQRRPGDCQRRSAGPARVALMTVGCDGPDCNLGPADPVAG